MFVVNVKRVTVSHVIYSPMLQRVVGDRLGNIWKELVVTTETLSRNVPEGDLKKNVNSKRQATMQNNNLQKKFEGRLRLS
jgi:hypothetical protein